MSELAAHEPWKNVVLAINMLRARTRYMREGKPLVLDSDGIIQKLVCHREVAQEGGRKGERRTYMIQLLTTPIGVDPRGDIILDVGECLISSEEIKNSTRTNPLTGLADDRLGVLPIRRDQIWQSVAKANHELGGFYPKIRPIE